MHPLGSRGRLLVGFAAVVSAGASMAAEPGGGAARLASVVAAARAAAARDGGALWGRSLAEVPFLFVDGDAVTLTADPAQPGYARAGALWTGARPRSLAPANTSVEWAGRRWAMVMLPLPDDPTTATRLLLHEAFHVLQPDVLPLPSFAATPAGAALLDEPDGRIWLQLEWRALGAALTARGGAQDLAVERALLFRARRFALASAEERTRERLLDEAEGMAEYTAARLGGESAAELAAAIARDAPAKPSFIRAFPYFTGPAYGFLLDARRPGWRKALRGRHDLAALLAETLPAARRPDAGDVRGRAQAAGAAFGLAALTMREQARWRARQQHIAELRRRFVAGPTLRLRPAGGLHISFDPRDQVSLGAAGTVMANVKWRDAGGAELDAPAGALVTPDWTELRVPLGDPPAAGATAATRALRGPGWTLRLPAGWRLARAGASWLATPR